MNKPKVMLGMTAPTLPDTLPRMRTFRAIMESKAPETLDRRNTKPRLMLGANDVLSDCTAVAIPNHMNMFVGMHGGSSYIPVSTQHVVDFYSATTGYSPNVPGSDTGADPTKVLTYACRSGFQADNYTYYPRFGIVDTDDRNALANTLYHTGSLYGAFALAQADQLAYSKNQIFDTTNPGNQEAWSWGGHLACPYDYTGLGDDDIVRIATWGSLYPATWRWVRARLVAGYGLLWRQLFDPMSSSPMHQNYEQFLAESQTYLSLAH